MIPRQSLLAYSLVVLLAIEASSAFAVRRSPQQQQQANTSAEETAFKAAENERSDPQLRIKLLESFVLAYPHSDLLPGVYHDISWTYLATENFVQAVASLDKFLSLGDDLPPDTRIGGLLGRAQAFYIGLWCGEKQFQLPEALAKAKAEAQEGLNLVGQRQRPPDITDAQFLNQTLNVKEVFQSILAIGTSRGLKESDYGSCKGVVDPGRFSRVIGDIDSQEQQTPRVR
jgi:hypothetical protein